MLFGVSSQVFAFEKINVSATIHGHPVEGAVNCIKPKSSAAYGLPGYAELTAPDGSIALTTGCKSHVVSEESGVEQWQVDVFYTECEILFSKDSDDITVSSTTCEIENMEFEVVG